MSTRGLFQTIRANWLRGGLLLGLVGVFAIGAIDVASGARPGGGGAEKPYTPVRLAFPGAAVNSTEGYDLNDYGNVAGSYTDGTGVKYGFYYHHATQTYTSLGDGSMATTVEGINQLNQLVGHNDVQFGEGYASYRGLYWSSPMAVAQPLRPLTQHTHSHAYAINNAGIIVGLSYNPEDPPVTPGFRAVVAWHVDAEGTVLGPVELPFLSGDIRGRVSDLTEASADITTVVGTSGADDFRLPVSWTVQIANSGLTVTGPIPFVGTYFLADAYGVNNNGNAVGLAAFSQGSAAAPFLRQTGQSMVALPLLPKASSGHATSINDAGKIVGFNGIFQKGQGFLLRAVLWTSSTTVVDLNSQVTLNQSEALDYARRINSRGDILSRINGHTPCLLIAK